jgi:hypothetical protein
MDECVEAGLGEDLCLHYNQPFRGSRQPHVLQCLHRVCQECAAESDEIKCVACQLQSATQPDFGMIGALCAATASIQRAEIARKTRPKRSVETARGFLRLTRCLTLRTDVLFSLLCSSYFKPPCLAAAASDSCVQKIFAAQDKHIVHTQYATR